MVEWLVPADVGLTASVSLIVFSAVTSFITAAAGIGGGIMMVAVMAVLMPAQAVIPVHGVVQVGRSEEHTSELQSLMRISYAVFCLKKKKKDRHINSAVN